jgi:hypothetical protein
VQWLIRNMASSWICHSYTAIFHYLQTSLLMRLLVLRTGHLSSDPSGIKKIWDTLFSHSPENPHHLMKDEWLPFTCQQMGYMRRNWSKLQLSSVGRLRILLFSTRCVFQPSSCSMRSLCNHTLGIRDHQARVEFWVWTQSLLQRNEWAVSKEIQLSLAICSLLCPISQSRNTSVRITWAAPLSFLFVTAEISW